MTPFYIILLTNKKNSTITQNNNTSGQVFHLR